MGERKVLNKYIPADFDPRLVPRSKKPKDDLVPVRMMLPFSIQCSGCSSFMYRGTKFNSKKEPMRGSEGKYLGIQRWRLYIKCTTCSRPISFLTDPKNTDYEMENGATRNYEVWHDKEKTEEDIIAEKEKDEKLDPMKALENRVLESQREMQDLENLDEIKAMNMRHLQMMSSGISGTGGVSSIRGGSLNAESTTPIINDADELNENGITASEEEMVRKIKFGKASRSFPSTSIKRINDDEEDELELSRKKQAATLEQQQNMMEQKAQQAVKFPQIKVKRKRITSSSKGKVKKTKASNKTLDNASKAINKSIEKPKTCSSDSNKNNNSSSDENGLGGLLGAYGSSSDSD